MTFEPKHLEPYRRPDHYAGAEFPEYYTVAGVHRDSDAIARSNWRVLLQACGFTAEHLDSGEIRTNAPNYDLDLPAFEPQHVDETNAPIVVTRAHHCLVGWLDTLRISRDADPAVLARLDEMIGGLNDYPILDESDHSDLEWSEACQYWQSCNVRDRVDLITRANENAPKEWRIPVFAARRDELPEDPAGRLYERLISC